MPFIAACIGSLMVLGLLAGVVRLRDCPWCLGHGSMAPHSGFVFEHEMLSCSMCKGRRRVTVLKEWSYDPLEETVRQWGPERRVPRR